jgi:predicted phosphodiesterase
MPPKTENPNRSSQWSSERVVFFGGVYSNYLALEALLEDARARGVQRLYCLGDLGAFGPYPDRACQILREAGIPVIQGNYDNSIGNGLGDCQCGYTDPRDNYFAKVSYDYTFRRTSNDNKNWLRQLAREIRIQVGPYRVLLCHGSPRKMNEFLWESTTSDAFLNWLIERYDTDVIVGTHTGLHWHREPSPGKHFINCGAIGRPGNDGQTTVVYAIVSAGNAENAANAVTAENAVSAGNADNDGSAVTVGRQPGPQSLRDSVAGGARPPEPSNLFPYHDHSAFRLRVDFVRLVYDYEGIAAEMTSERLPDEFVETIRTGWWTTCNEILPAKERARGLY